MEFDIWKLFVCYWEESKTSLTSLVTIPGVVYIFNRLRGNNIPSSAFMTGKRWAILILVVLVLNSPFFFSAYQCMEMPR